MTRHIVDNRDSTGLEYRNGSRGVRQGNHDKALLPNHSKAGIKIQDDVWDEMIVVAKYLCRVFPDPDVYDLFCWIREELQGCQPLSESMIVKADYEISNEIGPWT